MHYQLCIWLSDIFIHPLIPPRFTASLFADKHVTVVNLRYLSTYGAMVDITKTTKIFPRL